MWKKVRRTKRRIDKGIKAYRRRNKMKKLKNIKKKDKKRKQEGRDAFKSISRIFESIFNSIFYKQIDKRNKYSRLSIIRFPITRTSP